MKLNAGLVTEKLHESKTFYTQHLGFHVIFENDFYLLLQTPNKQHEISFLKPHHPSQHPIFHAPYQGHGLYLTIEVDNVDQLYQTIKAQGIPILQDLQNEDWGDRHFIIQDPNQLPIDLVTHASPS